MPSTATLTAKLGPGFTVTALLLTGVSNFGIDTEKEVLTVVSNGITQYYDISAATTILCTVTGNSYTLTVS